MESLSFFAIAVGSLLALARRCSHTGGRLQHFELLAVLTIAGVALAASFGVFIGPVGDAARYHETINACFGSTPPCGEKLHEIIWSVPASIFGPGWGLIYGFAIANIFLLLSRASAISWRRPVVSLLFLYCAYQVGNGMAEGTYVLLLAVSIIALENRNYNAGAISMFGALIAHLGNAPFVVYLLSAPRGLPIIFLGTGISATAIAIWKQIGLEDLYGIIGKAGALISQEATISAIEAKVRVSIQDAGTSYAETLLHMGFPFSLKAVAYSVWLYLFPIAASVGIFALVLFLLSATFTVAQLWLSRKNPLLLIIVILSFLIFAPATFTPGIGIRHKVPVFIFLLLALNSKHIVQMTWRK
ncbi:hypothetical protein [Pseudovibrio japonicus]|uniref:hypothetical protein n=1 Tax=Pseudovibrio japonicus TaxID=366534 RepID=UPI00167970BC|nr:hypothetical protein [Pseudovibrio japonicus]